MELTALARTVHDFLAESRDAVVVEDGTTLFDLQTARYSLSTDHGKCVLHLWSEERNCVRRVLDAQPKSEVLKLSVQRLGQPRPNKLEICRGSRSSHAVGEEVAAHCLSQDAGANSSAGVSGGNDYATDVDCGSGAIVRSDLCARGDPPGDFGVGCARSE